MIRCWRRFASSSSSSSVIPSLHRTLKEVLGENPSIGTQTKLHGWVRSIRKQKEIAFIVLGDGSTHKTVQAVASPEQVENVTTGASIQLQGQWTESPGSQQAKEIQVTQLDVVGESDPRTFPLQKKYHTSDYLRTIPALRWRTAVYSSMIRARSEIIWGISQFFRNANFLQVNTPIITTSDCEGGGDVFRVTSNKAKSSKDEYFNQPAYLTVSGQLHLEAIANAVTRVWTMGPAFRAEPSVTNRHLSEFWMIEAEAAFTTDLDQIMDICEQMVRHACRMLVDTPAGEDLLAPRRRYFDPRTQEASSVSVDEAQLVVRWELLMEPSSYRRITYKDAVKECQTAAKADPSIFEHGPPHQGDDLRSEHEKWVARDGPVFVTHYPRHLKPFYMHPGKTDPDTVECFDLMVPEMGELAGGSLRQHLPQELEKAIQTRNMDVAPLQWYLDIGRYGAVPHGGFGVGLDRLVCYLTGTSNLRESTLFPRWAGHCP